MLDSKTIHDLVDRLAAVLPDLGTVSDDIRGKMEEVLRKAFDELDLLSREEFEATAQRLERAEQRITELERTLTELEKRYKARR